MGKKPSLKTNIPQHLFSQVKSEKIQNHKIVHQSYRWILGEWKHGVYAEKTNVFVSQFATGTHSTEGPSIKTLRKVNIIDVGWLLSCDEYSLQGLQVLEKAK